MQAIKFGVAAGLFSHLTPEEVQRVTVAMTHLSRLPEGVEEEVVGSFSRVLGISRHRLKEAAAEEPAIISKAIMGIYGLDQSEPG